jgi:hypothetical protein
MCTVIYTQVQYGDYDIEHADFPKAAFDFCPELPISFEFKHC